MSPAPTPRNVIYFASVDELRAWFDANHALADELWLGSYRKATGRPSVTWAEAVDEALCVGWIDSVRYRVDDERSAQRFTPRRTGSNWSEINVANVARLTAEGRMRPTGLAAFEARRPEKDASHQRQVAGLRDDETAQIRANAAAWADWERRPPSYHRQVAFWISSAVRPETRARRLSTLIEDAAAGRKIKPLRPAGER